MDVTCVIRHKHDVGTDYDIFEWLWCLCDNYNCWRIKYVNEIIEGPNMVNFVNLRV